MSRKRRTPRLISGAMAVAILLADRSGVAEPVVLRHAARECEVALESLPSDRQPSLRLRPACRLGLDSTRVALGTMLPRALGDPPAGAFGLFMGRVEEYPWLSAGLVDAALRSPRWDERHQRLRGGEGGINAFVAELLRADERLRTLLPGWALRNVSVEKVLVGPAERYAPQARSKGNAPFDAMCWLYYEAEP
ncbi:MAG: hypothetical protein NFCOHLIN_01410 [Gammaproteobacteria bacterium]|nr:hypothetical protein [Gammaproteobacteria bacterium]